MSDVFVTGGTGYLGRHLIPVLHRRGHRVRALIRPVAHPAPVMRTYIAARGEAEALLRESGRRATILRPWYVLGPGHSWPRLLEPVYWLLERMPSTRPGALRLGLVTIEEMIRALVHAVERPAESIRIITVAEIRSVR